MAQIRWEELFGFSVPILELMIRGTAIYWFLFLVFRLVLRREMGSIGITDLLFIIVIADAAQNAMAGEYKSITDGFILILTIAAWNVFLPPPQNLWVKRGFLDGSKENIFLRRQVVDLRS
ncbi:MAG: hypothetical protein ACREVK_04415 [Gammaproteobacteria bacterium]